MASRKRLAAEPSRRERDRRRPRTWKSLVPAALAVLGLVFVTALAFAPVAGNDFVDWDDYLFLRDNDQFRGLGWDQIRYAWTFHLDTLLLFIPLSVHMLTLEDAIFGADPHGFHLFGVLLHIANAVALFALTLELLKRCRPATDARGRSAQVWASGLAVALYAVHPLRTELVAWATNQAYMLSTLFGLLALRAYLAANPADGEARTPWTIGAFALGLAAMLSQPLAVVLPIVLLLLDVYPLRRITIDRPFEAGRMRVWVEKAIFLVPSAAIAAIAVWVKGYGYLASVREVGPTERIAQLAYGAWFYLVKTAWPTGLTTYYPLPDGVTLAEPKYLLCALAIVVVTGLLLYWRRRAPGLLVSWIAYLILLTPYSGVVRYGLHIAADRYSYVPMMAWAVATAVVLLRAEAVIGRLGRWSRPGLGGLAAVGLGLTVGLVGLSRVQCGYWSDSIALWSHALAYAEDSPKLNYRLGQSLILADRVDEGLGYCRKSLRLDPADADLHTLFGATLAKRDELDQAAAHDLEALRLSPNHPEAHANLGAVLLRRNQVEEAIGHFEAALSVKPRLPVAHAVLGAALAFQGKSDEAIFHYSEALRLDPKLVEPRINRALALAQRGLFDQAVFELTEAVRIEPQNAAAHNTLGAVLAESGRLAEAAGEFTEVLRLDPNHAQARVFLDQIRGNRSGQVASGRF